MNVELLKAHTHASQLHCAGSVIAVDEITAHWLIEHGVGRAADSALQRGGRIRPDRRIASDVINTNQDKE